MSGIGGDGFLLDVERARRIGLPEAIYCAGKTEAQIDAIVAATSRPLLLTRLDAARFGLLGAETQARLDFDPLSRTAFSGAIPACRADAQVAIVSAGTSDLGVAAEAARTLRFGAEPAQRFDDVGVAGLWRLLDRIEEIRRFAVVIVVAGMDAALASVLGGLVGSPIVAVPTSVGYGAAEAGRTALGSMLASCAPGITVTNIDNGYGAACAALRLLGRIRRIEDGTA